MTAAYRIRLNNYRPGNAYTGFAASAGTAYKDRGRAIRTEACSSTGRSCSCSMDRVCMDRIHGGDDAACISRIYIRHGDGALACISRICIHHGDGASCISRICIRHGDGASCISRICIRHDDDASACISRICIRHGDDSSACTSRICIRHDDTCSYGNDSCRRIPAYTSSFFRRCTFSISLSRLVPIRYCSTIALTAPDSGCHTFSSNQILAFGRSYI